MIFRLVQYYTIISIRLTMSYTTFELLSFKLVHLSVMLAAILSTECRRTFINLDRHVSAVPQNAAALAADVLHPG
jgi:hypothetical protein